MKSLLHSSKFTIYFLVFVSKLLEISKLCDCSFVFSALIRCRHDDCGRYENRGRMGKLGKYKKECNHRILKGIK